MITESWLLVVLCLGAVIRLTRLVTEDVLTEPVRRWLVQHRTKPVVTKVQVNGQTVDLPDQDEEPDEDWLVYLIHCRWCASIWIAAPVAAVVWLWPSHWFVQIPLIALTASLLAGLSGRWE